MKKFLSFSLLFVAASIPAFAGTKSQTVTFPQAVEVGSTLVPAGSYALSVAGSGPTVQVTLAQGKKPVVTFSARAVQSKAEQNIATDDSGKVSVLESIQIKDLNLVLDETKASGQ
jgi:hypothetical protein